MGCVVLALCRVPFRALAKSVFWRGITGFRIVSMVEKLGVRGKKNVAFVVCPRSILNVVPFAAERLRARPIGFSVRLSMVPIPAGLL